MAKFQFPRHFTPSPVPESHVPAVVVAPGNQDEGARQRSGSLGNPPTKRTVSSLHCSSGLPSQSTTSLWAKTVTAEQQREQRNDEGDGKRLTRKSC